MTGDEAYQRRLAMSSGPQQQTTSVDHDMSGDDTYARRPEMPSDQLPPSSTVEMGNDAYQRRVVTMSSTSQAYEQEPPSEFNSLAYNPFAPVSVPSPPPGPPPSIEDEIARKREAAAAIAAKFSVLATVQPPEEPTPAPQNSVQRYSLSLLSG